MIVAVDNDVIYKGTCYGIAMEFCEEVGGVVPEMGVLGVARFVLPKKINEANLNRSTEGALTDLEAFLGLATELEPTDAERRLASEFELAAQQQGVSLDIGESQLCAIVIERELRFLWTGDKRAILAMAQLRNSTPQLDQLCGKVRCFEQIIRDLIEIEPKFIVISSAVCSEPTVDKAMTICFSCSNSTVERERVTEGFESYIRSLREGAGCILSS